MEDLKAANRAWAFNWKSPLFVLTWRYSLKMAKLISTQLSSFLRMTQHFVKNFSLMLTAKSPTIMLLSIRVHGLHLICAKGRIFFEVTT